MEAALFINTDTLVNPRAPTHGKVATNPLCSQDNVTAKSNDSW